MAYTKQGNSLCYSESLYFRIRVYLPISFLPFKLMFCFKRRQRQESIGGGFVITGHLFQSNLDHILGGALGILPPAVISFCLCNKIPQTQSLKIT